MNVLSRRAFLAQVFVGGVLGSVLLGACDSQATAAARPTAASATSPSLVRPASVSDVADNATSASVAPSATTTKAAQSRGTRQPNVLLITIDTLRADRIGAYGFGSAHTPTLDRLAAEGVRCDYAMCQLPQTNASHAALLTGLYPSTNGVKVHMVDHVRSDVQTMAEVFKGAGYQTAGIYSWVSLDPQFCGLDRGFDAYHGYVLNRSLLFSNSNLEKLSSIYRQIKSDVPVVSAADAALGSSEQIEKTIDGRADVTNAAVFDWLDKNAHPDSAPFFLWVHYFDPHYPYAPPEGYDHILGLKYSGKIDGSADTMHAISKDQLNPTPDDHARLLELYQGEIAYTDSQLGLLLKKLEDGGLLDDTILAVTGDHGESFGEHDDWIHGLKVFEPEIRVPLLLRYPPRVPSRVVVEAPVQSIDLMPTFLDLTGIKAPANLQGVSLMPVLGGTSDGKDRVAFTELADESFVSMLTYQEWKLIRNNANDELQLYHVSADAAEQKNLIDDQPQITRELRARLLDMMKFSGVSK